MINWIKRLNIYCKEMYPIPSRLFVGAIIFLEIHFIVLLNHGVTNFNLGIQEIIAGFTMFSFLFWLRIADDLKDYELDCRLFSFRPVPSGRTTRKDIKILAVILISITLIINFLYMNNFIFCFILYTYGSLMAVWFFQKHKIAKSLPLALVTHNPVQILLNTYIISFTIIKYNLPIFDLTALIWEVTRKIRAPKDETEYVTYSKLFGVNASVNFAMIVTIIDIITNFILVWNLNKITVVFLFFLVSWMTYIFIDFKKDPTRYKIVDKVTKYTFIQESSMIATVIIYLLVGKIG